MNYTEEEVSTIIKTQAEMHKALYNMTKESFSRDKMDDMQEDVVQDKEVCNRCKGTGFDGNSLCECNQPK